MFFVGIDPGAAGGISIIPKYDFAATAFHDISKMTLSDIADFWRDLRTEDSSVYVLLENPQLPHFDARKSYGEGAMTHISVSTHRKLGQSVGQQQGLATAFGYIPILISPQKWQSRLNCRTKGDKNVTKSLAMKVFPLLKRQIATTGEFKSTITHNVADSLLIALYAYLEHADPKYVPRTVYENVSLDMQEVKRNDIRSKQPPASSNRLGPICTPTKRRLPPRGRRSS